MPDQNGGIDSQYRGSADRFVVELVEVGIAKPLLERHVVDDLYLLDDRVAHDSVAYHDVGDAARENVLGFDVADEAEVGAAVHQFVGGFGLQVAFLLFLADVEQCDTGLLLAQNALGVQVTDDGVLIQHLRFAVHVQSHVEQHHAAAVDRRNDRRYGRPDDAFDLLDRVHAAYHHRSRAPGAGESVDPSFRQVAESDGNARIGLLAKGQGRIVAHLDHLGGMHDVECVGAEILLGEELLDRGPVAEQDDLALRSDQSCGQYGARYHRLRSVVSAHCVNSYSRHKL